MGPKFRDYDMSLELYFPSSHGTLRDGARESLT